MRNRSRLKAFVTIVLIAAMALSAGDSAGSVPGMDTDLGDSAASFIGEDAHDYSGWSVAGAGDVNGDGYEDILIGANGDGDGGADAGQTYLILGKAPGWSMDIDLSNADASFWGENGGDNSGSSVAGAGDVNGDGYDDILIGASGNDDGGSNAGQTYLILGKASGWSMDTDLSAADASFWGENARDNAGRSVASAGDVNGDGYDDILIGAHSNDDGGNMAGQTYLILGKKSGWSMDTDLSNANASFWGEDGGDAAGWSVAGVGNVNGDGYDDILIGAISSDDGGASAGQTYLILGKASGWSMDTNLSNANASFWGEDADDMSGSSVAGAGDVNGDGYDDLLISAPVDEDGGGGAGQTYLILGKASGWSMDTDLSNANASFWGEDANDQSGCSVAGAGDVNGDGYDDILIGALWSEDGGTTAGQTYLILGKVSGWSMDTDLSNVDASFIGEDADDRSGWSVAGAGDVNGDGCDDILIGARNNDDGGSNAGQTYLVFYYEGVPPVWGQMPSLNAIEDVPFTFDFSGNVSDPDTPFRNLVITSPSQYVTSTDGLNVTFQFPNGVLSADVPLVLSDRCNDVQRRVNFTIQPVNDPPEHDIPEQQTAKEDVPWTMDLTPSVWDVDNETNELFLVVDSPYSSVDGLNLTMLFPEPIDEYDVWFNISDGINTTPVKLHFTIIPAPRPPGAPTYFTVTAGDGSVELEWRAPQYDGGSSILGYRVFRGLAPDALSHFMEVDAFTVTYTDTDVTNGVTYHYAMRAFNGLGDSVLSYIESAMPVGSPGVPLSLTAEAEDGAVSLSWEPPGTDGGSAIIGYRISKGETPGSMEVIKSVITTVYEDTSVTNGMIYHYKVQAYNSIGDGPFTDATECRPAGPPDAPGDLIVTGHHGYIEIQWLPPISLGGLSLLHYNLYRGSSEGSLEFLKEVDPETTDYRDEDVEIGATYFYAVGSVTEVGESALSIVVNGYSFGTPGIPNDVSAMPGDGEVTLSWSAPEEDGASSIEGYVILRGTSAASLLELVQLGDIHAYLDTSVTNGETYYYAIAAINEAGSGDYTETASATPFKPPTAPGKVMTLVADTKGKTVTLQWTAPQDDGGSQITGYVILRGITKDSLEQVAEVGPDVTTWSEDGLERGTTHYYSVSAKNDVGEGEPILAREVKVPKKEEESPALGGVFVLLAMLVGMAATMMRRKGW